MRKRFKILIGTMIFLGMLFGAFSYFAFTGSSERMSDEEIRSRVFEFTKLRIPVTFQILRNKREYSPPAAIHGIWMWEVVTVQYAPEAYHELRDMVFTEFKYRMETRDGHRHIIEVQNRFQFVINDEELSFSYYYSE